MWVKGFFSSIPSQFRRGWKGFSVLSPSKFRCGWTGFSVLSPSKFRCGWTGFSVLSPSQFRRGWTGFSVLSPSQFRPGWKGFSVLSPKIPPGAPHLARFSRDVGYHRSTPQACCSPHNSPQVPHVRTSVPGPKTFFFQVLLLIPTPKNPGGYLTAPCPWLGISRVSSTLFTGSRSAFF
jgi:hypothetical protein